MSVNSFSGQPAIPASYGFTAGKNKIINGDFGVWQRGTSISLPNGTWTYGPDRFAAYSAFSAGSSTFSQQTFTPGSAPIAGYEGTYFSRVTLGSTASFFQIEQRIEDVRAFAGQTATVSFWAKSSGTPTVKVTTYQNFGTGGSTGVNTDGANFALTSSWVRYTATLSFPSISGKTIGTNSSLNVGLVSVSGTLNGITIDTWGWQIENGSTATSFQTATGTIQGELAACQRYYYRVTATQSYSDFATGYNPSSSEGSYLVPFPVEMRITPTALEQTGAASNYNILHSSGGTAARSVCNSVPTFQQASKMAARVYFLVPGGSLTAGQGSIGGSSNNTTAYLGWSAEL